MAFFKRGRSRRGVASELIPRATLELVDDVEQMEEKVHTMQRALKKYVTARKDEASKLAKLGRTADQLCKAQGLNFTEDLNTATLVEQDLIATLAITGLDPLKSYCKLFPKLNDVTGSLVRTASDHKKAIARNDKARGDPKRAPQAKAALERTQSELDTQLSRIPPCLSDVLVRTQAYFATAACAAIQGRAIYTRAVQEFLASSAWAGIASGVTSTSLSPDTSESEKRVAETTALLDKFQEVSIVGSHRKRESRGSAGVAAI